MKSTHAPIKYVAFLRGINVGGHHKVPMSQLKGEMESLGFVNVVTLLNSGNILFYAIDQDLEKLQNTITAHVEKTFGFPIPSVVREADTILDLLASDPFKEIILTKEIRLYISFLWKDVVLNLELPWISEDHSFKILSHSDKIILSVLDLSVNKTPKAMEALEKTYGKDITTRNWNTILRIGKKLDFSK